MQDFETIDLTPGVKSETIEIEEVIVVEEFNPLNDNFRVERRDLTLTNSISAAVQPLISEMDALLKDRINHLKHFKELKEKFANIIKDESISASKETRRKWIIQLEKQKNLTMLCFMISNLTMAGAGLKVGLDNY